MSLLASGASGHGRTTRLRAPRLGWQLAFDADVFCMMSSEEPPGELTFDVDDMLGHACYTSQAGHEVAVAKGKNTSNIGEARSTHTCWDAAVPFGFTQQKAVAMVAVFKKTTL